MICKRCSTIMYPGKRGNPSNHKPGYCSDGVVSTLTAPKFPLPPGIFLRGTAFSITTFYATVQQLFECMCVNGQTREDLSLELDTFAQLFSERIKEGFDGRPGNVFWELYDGIMLEGVSASRIDDYVFQTEDGKQYLRVLCL